MGGLERSCKKNSVAKFFRRICHINPHQHLERWQRRRSTLLSCAPSDATESLGSALCPFFSSSFHAECQGGTVSRYLSSVLFKADYPPHVCSLIPGQEPAPALAAGPNTLLENNQNTQKRCFAQCAENEDWNKHTQKNGCFPETNHTEAHFWLSLASLFFSGILRTAVFCALSLEAVEAEPACAHLNEAAVHNTVYSKALPTKQDLWFLPAESNCNLTVPRTGGQIAIYCEPRARKKLNSFGGYRRKYTFLLTDSRNCFPLHILGEEPTPSTANVQLEVKSTISCLAVIAQQGRGKADRVQWWQSTREGVQSHLSDFTMSLQALCH